MKKLTAILMAAVMLAGIFSLSAAAAVSPSTWTAVDGLGRTLSDYTEAGTRREDRFVGMFYWTWHYPWTDDTEPITTGSVLNEYPEAVNDWDHFAWNGTYSGRPYFWDEPLYGFYTNTDEYILRKHAELLADADIDTVIFDTTNSTLLFTEGYIKLLEVWSKAREEGVNTPDVMFILNFAGSEDCRTQLIDLYDNLYSKGLYKDLWFMWEGKPLVMADIAALDFTDEKDKEIFEFFTFRDNEATYFAEDYSYSEGTWGWCSDYPQTKFGKKLTGQIEQMCVSVAQNANENGLTAMNSPVGTVQGRSFTDGAFSYSYSYAGKEITVDKDIENSLLYGLNFQQQWDYAIENDPEFIFITGFNEWIAGRFDTWCEVENAFPDQFSPAYSRDIEPSKGILKDHYYYQLVENVRRFKGADAPGKADAEKTIDISADASQWESVSPEYNHYEGLTDRDSAGWVGYSYENHTGRNDIVKTKTAFDSENVYFMVEAADALTAETDENWMQLYIDTDFSGISPEWAGFEYRVSAYSPESGTAALGKYTDASVFEEIAKISYSVNGNILQLSIPREALGLSEEIVKFNFKWTDNADDSDVMNLYVDGDSAPGGRFAFCFDSSASSVEITDEPQETGFRAKLDDLLTKLLTRADLFFASVRNYFVFIFK